MRLSHPYVFVIGIVCVVLFFVAVGAVKLWRTLRWPVVQRERRGWIKRTARVQKWEHLAGTAFRLELVVPLDVAPERYRAGRDSVVLRGVVFLPEELGARLEGREELPLRIRSMESWLLNIDLEAILGDDAAPVERAAYMSNGGAWRFTPIG